ncbi:unnamed protein product [Durusdinium trenchii]|uniref:Uncharacterized protein n=1 Tax=Durusdinium trenchii TaxID=1381693 RepID=A0ABP0LWX3_9DINO
MMLRFLQGMRNLSVRRVNGSGGQVFQAILVAESEGLCRFGAGVPVFPLWCGFWSTTKRVLTFPPGRWKCRESWLSCVHGAGSMAYVGNRRAGTRRSKGLWCWRVVSQHREATSLISSTRDAE